MQRKGNGRRILAAFLAAAMTLSQSGITTFAEEGVLVAENAAAESEQAEAERKAEEERKAAEAAAAAKAEEEHKAAEAAAAAKAEEERKAAEAAAAAKAEEERKAAEAAEAARQESERQAAEAAKAESERQAAEAARAESEQQAQQPQETTPTEGISDETEAAAQPQSELQSETLTEGTSDDETESDVRENQVAFRVEPEGATVLCDGKDVTNAVGAAKNGTILFTVTAEEGYEIESVVEGEDTPVQTTENESEYIIEGIETDDTVVTITTVKTDAIVEQRVTTASGIEVIARYTKDTFAEDVELQATDAVITEDLKDYLMEQALNPYTAVSVDISFLNENGTELQPTDDNSVNIQLVAPELMQSAAETAEALSETTSLSIVHTADNGANETLGEAAITTERAAAIASLGNEVTEAEDVTLSGKEVIAFDAEAFSKYTVATDGNLFTILNTWLANKEASDTTLEITLDDATIGEAYTKVPANYVPSEITSGLTVTIDLKGHTLSNPDAIDEGWFKVNGGTLTIKSTGTEKGTLTGSKKSVVNVLSGTLNLENCNFKENTSNEGAAVHIEGTSTLNIKDSVFEKNTAAAGGGAIFIYGSNVTTTIEGSTFEENSVANNNGDGGAIRADGTITIKDNSVFKKNSAKSGGAIKLENGTLSITNSTFGGDSAADGNTAKEWGGAIFSWDENSTVTLSSATIKNNSAGTSDIENQGEGGGLYIGGTLNLSAGDVLSNNKAYHTVWGNGGGAISTRNTAKLNITGGTIENNYARGSGGGILSRGSFEMTGGTVQNNTAQVHEGGGLSIMGGYAILEAGTFTGNKTGYNEDGSSYADYVDWGGGGIFVADQGDATLSIPTTVLVTGNSAGGYGGGVAGCATGRIMVFSHENVGAAIYSNSASGANLSGEGSAKSEDRVYAGSSDTFTKNGFKDYFCALSSAVSNTMFNGGYENWTGSADGQPVQAEKDAADIMYASSVMGLTANPTNAPSSADVVIQGNASHTHGGGILCNGYLLLGNPTKEDKVVVSKPLVVEVSKGFLDAAGETLSLEDKRFQFKIEEITDGKADKFSTTGTNDDNGVITFKERIVYNENTCDKAYNNAVGPYTFVYLLTETTSDSTEIAADHTQYRITVTVEKVKTTLPKIPAIDKTNYKVKEVVVERKTSETALWETMGSPLAELIPNDEAHAAFVKIHSDVTPAVMEDETDEEGNKVLDDNNNPKQVVKTPAVYDPAFINHQKEIPEIEKYVNKDVHADLDAFDSEFTYDIIAYITKDADSAEITDTLVDALKFKSAAGEVTTVDLGESIDHTVNGSVSDSGTAVSGATATINEKTLTVAIADAKSLRGHYVKVTFKAVLDNDVVGDFDQYTSKKKSVTGNGIVLEGAASHEGIDNTASYKVKVDNDYKYTEKSNTVTVTPKTTKVYFEKVWKDITGATLNWPSGATVEVQLQKKAGEAEAKDVTGKKDTLTATKTSGSFEDLPVYENTVYSVKEALKGVEENAYTSLITENEIEGGKKATITNTKGEVPQIEKYVNKDVHADLEAFDETFTYDIIAYITKDADSAEITDTLVEALKFKSAESEVQAVDLGTEVDHTVNGSVAESGSAVSEAKASITEKTLTVTIADAKNLRGHYVKVTFTAALDNDVVGDLSQYSGKKVEITANGIVLGGAETHEGIDNKASYQVKVGNDYKYKETSNTVTVTPATTKVLFAKEWIEDGKRVNWPEGAEITVELLKNGEKTGETKTLNQGTQSAKFENLPVFTDVTYSIAEKSVTGVSAAYKVEVKKNADGSYTITNTLTEKPEIEKYVNKDVHADLDAFDSEFTYDIIAYITKDADSAEITDTLVEALKFKSADGEDITTVDLGENVDHTVKGSVSGSGKTVSGARATIDGKTLTVAIADAKSLRGHYVKVTFEAVLDNDVVGDFSQYTSNSNKKTVTKNGIVLEGAASHEGIENTASYKVKVGNDYKYKEDSNTVTVTPKTTKVEFEKVWKDIQGATLSWPKGAEVTVQLQKSVNGAEAEDVSGKSVKLNATKTSGSFADLPVYEGTVYSVKETLTGTGETNYTTKITDETQANSSDKTYRITNTRVEEPTFTKKIQDINDSEGDSSKSDWQDSADYDIGDAVPFKLTATLPNDVTEYTQYHITFEDELEKGLTFNKDSVKVLKGEDVLTAGTDYTLTTTDARHFTVTLTWKGESNGKISDTSLNKAVFTVLFDAELNSSAKIGSEGNVNKARLEYSSKPGVDKDGKPYTDTKKTPYDSVIAFTYKAVINKVDKDKNALKGAEFKLEKKLADGKTKEVARVAEESGATFTFNGLDDGTYVLTETKVPAGYKAIDPITFTVEAEHVAEWNGEANTRTGILTSLSGTDQRASNAADDGVITFTADKAEGSLTANVVNNTADEPTVVKKIQDKNDSTPSESEPWQDSADYDIGDAVPFKLTATLADNVSDYQKYHITFHDTMEKGLTFDQIECVTLKAAAEGAEAEDIKAEALKGFKATKDGFDLTITWDGKGEKLSADLNKATVEVQYTATLNENAELGSKGNVNTVYLSYSNNPSVTTDKDGKDVPNEDEKDTPKDSVIAFTYKVVIDKVDKNKKALEGAAFKLEKKLADGKMKEVARVAGESGATFTFKGLDDGTYVLTETTVPAGYKAIDPIEFTVTATHNKEWDGKEETRKGVLESLNGAGTETGVIPFTADKAEGSLTADVVNEQTRVSIAKVDANDNSKLLAGAEMEVLDASGEVKQKWTSTTSAQEITGLLTGVTYTLRETVAPNGYKVTADSTFTVDAKGVVTASAKQAADGTILVQDEVAAGKGSVQVTKYTLKNDGAFKVTDQTYYTALFSDSAMTTRVTDVKPLVLKNTYTTTVTFENLDYGTYYVAETDELGNRITSAPNISKVEISGGTAVLSAANKSAEATIRNTVPEGVLGEYVPVNLTVKKNVEDANGNALNVKDTFRFRLFYDEACTEPVTRVGIQTVKLDGASSGTATFEDLPYADAFYVAEVDKDGNPVGSDFGYKVSYTNNAGLSYAQADGAAVTVTNRQKSGRVAGDSKTPAKAVRTGDNTPILPLLASMLTAALAAIYLLLRRRRNMLG